MLVVSSPTPLMETICSECRKSFTEEELVCSPYTESLQVCRPCKTWLTKYMKEQEEYLNPRMSNYAHTNEWEPAQEPSNRAETYFSCSY